MFRRESSQDSARSPRSLFNFASEDREISFGCCCIKEAMDDPKQRGKTTGKKASMKGATMGKLMDRCDDNTWLIVAGYATPPDIYNLSMASKRFFDDKEKKFATRLLRRALDVSFDRTLAVHTSLDRAAVDRICVVGFGAKPGVVVTGSTMVRTVLGATVSRPVETKCDDPHGFRTPDDYGIVDDAWGHRSIFTARTSSTRTEFVSLTSTFSQPSAGGSDGIDGTWPDVGGMSKYDEGARLRVVGRRL